ncbi:hypothetical protein ILUMI_14403 [Ignelater luminosus]|uniref:Sulfotransferase domain-containing protein n=1 Tax=Ignelater luminosus TaxID=2038154 RepID=A0A8K0CQJ2_IGNLU|nr:hypothetical protein ILUMI_14403 [Ignelater luminosus]
MLSETFSKLLFCWFQIIYVTRNPKDTCVSYYHHCRFIEGFKGEFNDFCDLFIEGKGKKIFQQCRLCLMVISTIKSTVSPRDFGPFWTNVSQYWERRNQPNVFFLKYEDLKKDLPACIKEMTKFLGKHLNEDQIKLLTNHLSFSSMKTNKAVNYDDFITLHKNYKLIETDGDFIRAGNVNGYKGEMTEELIRKLDMWMEEQPDSEKLGYR